MAATAKIAISIDKQLLLETNRIARKRKLPRSRVIVKALQHYLRVEREEEMAESWNRVYASGPDADEMKFLKAARVGMGRRIKKEGW